MYGNLLRPTRLPKRKRRSNVTNPIRAINEFKNMQIIALKCLICVREWVRFCAEHNEKRQASILGCLSFFMVTRTGIEPMLQP